MSCHVKLIGLHCTTLPLFLRSDRALRKCGQDDTHIGSIVMVHQAAGESTAMIRASRIECEGKTKWAAYA